MFIGGNNYKEDAVNLFWLFGRGYLGFLASESLDNSPLASLRLPFHQIFESFLFDGKSGRKRFVCIFKYKIIFKINYRSCK